MNNQKKLGIVKQNENCIDFLNCKRRMDWTKEWLLKRSQFGHCDLELLPELRLNEEVYHFNNFFKMTEKQFRFLVEKLAEQITTSEPHRKKKPFTAEERLAVTLKYLATGEVHTCKHYAFRATQGVILKMVANICMKIYENLKDEFIKLPATKEEWQEVSRGFYDKCRLPNCVGALEGKHITFRKTHRYCDENTLVLMAIIDSNSNFIFADVGERSNLDDRDIFNRSVLKKSLDSDALLLPNDDKLPNADMKMQSFLVANQSFPLLPYIMKQFYVSGLSEEQLFFDFRLWDVGQRADHCFELLTNTFPVLLEPFKLDPENAKKVTLGCIALHNFLRKSSNVDSNEVTIIDDDDDDEEDEEPYQKTGCLCNFRLQGPDNESAKQIRNTLMNYIVANRN